MSSVDDDRTSVALSLNSQMEKTKEKVQRREFKIFFVSFMFPSEGLCLVGYLAAPCLIISEFFLRGNNIRLSPEMVYRLF